MFLHIGKDILLEYKKIIGIFDWSNTQVAKAVQDGTLFADKRRIVISDQPIKSCVVTDRELYLSHISSYTLKKRSQSFWQM